MSEELKTVKEIEEYLQTALEQRKNDVIKSAGAVSSAKEFVTVHNQFLEKARNELQTMASEGKVTVEVANFALVWLTKSHNVAVEYSTASKSRHDIKSGETLGIDATSRLIKSVKERELKKLEEAVEQIEPAPITDKEARKVDEPVENVTMAAQVEQPVEVVEAEKPVKKPRGKKQKVEPVVVSPVAEPVTEVKEKKLRPDERGKVAETVQRMKAARAAKKLKA